MRGLPRLSINGASLDNCPETANASQTDTDGNGTGDACTNDVDGDGCIGSCEIEDGFDC
jgi:hypothetical protein